jgi:WD40-like Beta Propeller Repeat
MEKIYKLLSKFLSLLIILSLPGCLITSASWHQSVPKAEIIFQSNMRGPYELSFIQSDGSNPQVLNIDENFIKPVWSSDGTILYGLSSPTSQFPYEDIGYPSYWDIKNGMFKRCDENLPYYGQIEEYNHTASQNKVLLYNAFEIVVFDLNTCKQNKILVDFNNRRAEYTISGFSYFPETQELIFGRYITPYQEREYHLVKLDLKTGEQVEMDEGINPIWSPDGNQIAYLGLDGLYVIQANGQQPRKLVNKLFFDPYSFGGPGLVDPQPRWSPDGEWLVYHQCVDDTCDVKQTPIYKVRVSDGMEEKIFTGGKFPSWQP